MSIVVVDVIRAVQSTDGAIITIAELDKGWGLVGVGVESVKSHREMGAVWRSCSLLMYVVVGWLIIWSFVISFIMRDLRTRSYDMYILSSSGDESECDDACVGCVIAIGDCVVHWAGGSVNTLLPQLIVL